MRGNSFLVTLDNVPFQRKPTNNDVRAITRRMQQRGAQEFDAASLSAFVRQGGTFCGACYEPCADGWGRFRSLQIVSLDLDNDAQYQDRFDLKKRHKRPLCPDEVGYLPPAEAVARCEALGLEPMLLYYTFHNSPAWCRYRVVLDLGEPIEEEAEACSVIAALMTHFPECDQSCSNANRLFFGTSGQVIELWKGEALA